MADIKSAWEIAQEKLGKIGEATPEERVRWKYIPEGERLAAQYIKDDTNLAAEINKYNNAGERKYVKEGVEEVLIRNISLPTTDFAKKNNKRIMDTLKSLKKDKVAVENIYSQMRRIFQHYVSTGEEQRKQAYQQLKMDFAGRLREAMAQQGINPETRVDVERQPEFQSEWRKMSARLDEQYIKHLDEFKKQLVAVE
jgi:hypothetical protein